MAVAWSIDYRSLADKSHLIYLGADRRCSSTCCSSARCAAARGAGSTSASSTCSRRSSPRSTLALVLAKLLGESRRHALTNNELFIAAVLTAVPLLLIARQPDLGTAVTLLPILLVRRLRRRHADEIPRRRWRSSRVLAAPVAWKFALQDYQHERIATFLDPEQDARGAGYQQIQARITVGSGGVWGKGFMQGTQGQLRFLPVAHNDFIFSVLAEEQGFVGVLVALGLVPVRDHARARGGPAGQGPARRVSGAGRAGQLHVPGDLQHHHVGGTGAGQGTDAAAHELRRLLDDRDAGGLRAHPQRADAPIHELSHAATPRAESSA